MPTAADRLQQAHQREIATIAGGVTSVVASVALGADPLAIMTWYQGVVDGLVSRIQVGYAQTRQAAMSHLPRHAALSGADVQAVPGSLDVGRLRSRLQITGPVAFKTAIGAGHDTDYALRSMAVQMSGVSGEMVRDGDRDVIEQTALRGRGVVGWRRRLAGRGCGFCAMLASRGAVYVSKQRASVDRSGERYHAHCRCYPEPLYQHEDEPQDVKLLQRQWQRVTAGHSGADAQRAWRQHWEQRATPQARERFALPLQPSGGAATPGPAAPVRQVLADARSPEAVSRALEAEYQRITGRTLRADFRGSVETAREHAEGVLRTVERYPEIRIQVVRTGTTARRSSYAEASPGYREIVFSSQWAQVGKRQEYLDSLAAAKQRGYLSGPGDPTGVAMHETGHLLDTGGSGLDRQIDELLADVQRRTGVPPDRAIRAEISEYAQTNHRELVAESIADVVANGDKASPLSVAIARLAERQPGSGGRAIFVAPAEVLPMAAARPRTVAQLRARVADAGITVPEGLPRPGLVRLVEDLERGVPPAQARQAAAAYIVELRRQVSDALVRASDIVGNERGEKVMRWLAGTLRKNTEPEALKTLKPLLEALDAADLAKVQAAIPAVARAGKVKQIGGQIGDVGPFRTGEMEWIGKSRGEATFVIAPGYSTTFDGATTILSRAAVAPATPEQIAELGARKATKAAAKKAAPTKAAKAAPAKKATPRAQDLTGTRGLSADPAIRAVQVENRIRQAYAELRRGGSAREVTFADLREHPLLRDLSRADQDAAILALARQPGAGLERFSTYGGPGHRREVAAGIDDAMPGFEPGQRLNATRLVIDDPSLRPLPAAPAKAAKKAAAPAKTVAKKAAPAPRKAPAPKAPPPPERMTAPALGKELTDRGVPAELIADLPKPAQVSLARRLREGVDPTEETGRIRQAVIDRQRALADALAEASELLDNGASAKILAARAAQRLKRVESLVEGWPAEAPIRSLVTAMQTGNPAAIRRALAAAERRGGLTRLGGAAGDTLRYDRRAMSPLEGELIPDGATVRVVRPGYDVTVGGQRVTLMRPVVEVADEPVKAVKKAAKAPAKKAPAKKATTAPDPTGARGLSTDPAVREVQIENRIREAYAQAPKRAGGGVLLSDLRPLLEGVDRADVDAALIRLGREHGGHLGVHEARRLLTDAQRAAGIEAPGGGLSYLLELRGASLTAKRLPAVKAAKKAAPAKAPAAKKAAKAAPPAKKTAAPKATPVKAAKKAAAPASGRGAAGTGTVQSQMDALPKIADPEDISAVARSANPKYLSSPYTGEVTPEIAAAGGATYSFNCTRVAMAYEARRRGIDVTAGAATVRGDHPGAYVRSFRTKDGKYAVRIERDLDRSSKPKPGMSADDIVAEVKGWPVGARGIVVMEGHTLNVERTASGVRFIDAQAGSRKNPVLTPAQFKTRATGRGAPVDRGMAVARVDDLDMSDYSLHYFEGEGLDVNDGIVLKTRYPDTPDMHLPSDEDLLAMVPDDSYPGSVGSRRAKESAPEPKAPATLAARGGTAPAGTIKTMHKLDDEASGMRSRVSSISHAENDFEDHYPQFRGWSQVNLEITSGSGRALDDVGYATVLVSPDGHTVYYSALALDAPVQGQGFITRLMTDMFERYKAAGVETLGIRANADVGGYAWARAGFGFLDDDARREFAEYARAYARGESVAWYEPGSVLSTTRRARLDPEVAEAILRVADNPLAEPADYAAIGHVGGSKMWPGKEMMLGSAWRGKMDL